MVGLDGLVQDPARDNPRVIALEVEKLRQCSSRCRRESCSPDLHGDLEAVVSENLGRMDRVTIGFMLVSRELSEDGSAGRAAPHLLEKIGDEVGLVRVMHGRDVEPVF